MTSGNAQLQSELEAHFRSQVGQDRWLHQHVFKGRRDGVFIDVGAFGEEGSNTWFFEKALGWRGLLIEANPERIPELQAKRAGPVLNCAVYDHCGTKQFLQITGANVQLSGLTDNYTPAWRAMLDAQHAHLNNQQQVIQVPCRTLASILEEHSIRHVDYMSVDTEGSELAVLRSIPWHLVTIDVLTVEDNNSTREAVRFLAQRGYSLIHSIWPDLFFMRTALL